MDDNNNIKYSRPVPPFVRYCSAIIPTAFDDSLSYYEALCALNNFLQKNVVEVINNNAAVTEDYIQLTKDLKSYVENYFANLDVQEEIDNKLDEMAEDGSLGRIIDEQLASYEAVFNAAIEGEADSRIAGDEYLQNEINSLASGSPLVAASTAGMTDTSRVYVNTTDGKWYYYNGSAWTAGGTYQSTAIADDTVHYNALTALAGDDEYRTITAEDMIWRSAYMWSSGKMTNDSSTTNYICSCPVRVSKNSIVSIDSSYHGRLTYWQLDGTYIGDTGSFAQLASVSVPQDCFMGISLRSNPTGTPITSSDISNEDITVVGLVDKKCDYIRNSLNFTRSSSSVVISDKIYLGKGAKIWATPHNIKQSNSNYTETVVYIKAVLYEEDRATVIQTIDFDLNTVVTLPKDCFVQLYARKRGSQAILDEEIPLFKNYIEIDNVQASNITIPDKKLITVYNGATTELFIINHPTSAGHILLTWEGGNLALFEGYNQVIDYSVSDALTALSQAGYSYQDKTWIDIPNQQMLYYDRLTTSLKIRTWKSSERLEGLIYPLLKNSYSNAFGKLLDLKNRTNGDASEIFNSTLWYDSVDWKAPCKTYNALVNTDSTIEAFCFFTDPHCMGTATTDQSATMQKRISLVQKVYNSTPTNFIVCGGDWLNNGGTADLGAFKLGYIDGFMTAKFDNYYPVLGNHDLNNVNSPDGLLSNGAIANLMFSKWGKAYYSFDGLHSKNYVLDNALDNTSTTMDSYRWEQVDWFANKIIEDDPTHATVFMHIAWRDVAPSYPVGVTCDNITKVIAAYNAHSTVSLNSRTYDFSGCSGHIDYVITRIRLTVCYVSQR